MRAWRRRRTSIGGGAGPALSGARLALVLLPQAGSPTLVPSGRQPYPSAEPSPCSTGRRLPPCRYLGGSGGARCSSPVDKLPGWMRPSLVKQPLDFGQVMGRLHRFFKEQNATAEAAKGAGVKLAS